MLNLAFIVLSSFNYFTPQYGAIACTTISVTTAATAVTVLTLNQDRRVFMFTNSCDQPIVLTYAGTAMLELPAGVGAAIDLRAADLAGEATKVIGAYKVSSTPTAGRLAAGAL